MLRIFSANSPPKRSWPIIPMQIRTFKSHNELKKRSIGHRF